MRDDRHPDVIVLELVRGKRPAPSAEVDRISRDADSARLHAERDAALEDAAFLREQLTGVECYYAQLLHEERARLIAERQSLLGTIDVLAQELHRRASRESDGTANDGAARALANSRTSG